MTIDPPITEQEAEVYSRILTRGLRDTFSRNGGTLTKFPDLKARLKLFPNQGMVLTVEAHDRQGQRVYQAFVGSISITVPALRSCVASICADMIQHETGLSPESPAMWEVALQYAKKVEEL
jgi:hypothetical protein